MKLVLLIGFESFDNTDAALSQGSGRRRQSYSYGYEGIIEDRLNKIWQCRHLENARGRSFWSEGSKIMVDFTKVGNSGSRNCF